ncbi:MAG: DUF2939 domain-containing protein [Hyphomicrobiaceae bacterium]
MRKTLIFALMLSICAAAYSAAPFLTAWQIREAVRQGDVPTLQAKVDWDSVRRSLKSSLGETRQALVELADAGGQARPGFWQRLKMAAMPFLRDPLIDRYVTAEAAPRLYEWRQSWRQKVRPKLGITEAPTLLAGTWLDGSVIDRHLSVLSRVEATRFVSPTRLDIEIADRYRPNRLWIATLEFVNLNWRLTEMRVRKISPESSLRTAGL